MARIADSYQYGAGTTRAVERWASLAAATATIAYGISRRNAKGLFLAAAVAPLAYRGAVGHWPWHSNGRGNGYENTQFAETREALGGDRGVNVRESIRLETPVAEVYEFWRQLQNLPRFMTHLESVTDLGNGRSHWVAKGPAGLRVEWDAEIFNEVENKVIAWRSQPGSDVVTAGSVTFAPVRGGRTTQVTVNMQYAPPAGRAGAFLAQIFGREPSQTIREDLRNLKQTLEAGETPRTARHQVTEPRV
jgi:uncharacterized membrane protein